MKRTFYTFLLSVVVCFLTVNGSLAQPVVSALSGNNYRTNSIVRLERVSGSNPIDFFHDYSLNNFPEDKSRDNQRVAADLSKGLSTAAIARKPIGGSFLAIDKQDNHKHLAFVENKGQVRDQFGKQRNDIQFSFAAQNGLSIFVGKGKIHYQFSESSLGSQTSNVDRSRSEVIEAARTTGNTYNMYRLDVELIGANENPRVRNEQKIDYVENYFSSHVKESGATANAYSRIVYENVYPNIDWILSANKGKLKHEFIVHKGGNVADIKLRYGGASNLDKSQNGGVVANTPLGNITETAPYCYQSDKKVVSSEFVVNGDIVSYNIGKYIGELTIDPNLDWATYFGGSGNENGNSSAIDASGNLYFVGSVATVSGIVTSGTHQTTYGGGTNDALLVKFDNAGNRLWATYYGGSADDQGFSVAIDGTGNVYLGGWTLSTNGIASSGAYQTSSAGGLDGFLVKFNSSGTRLWGTFFGGPGYDYGGYSVVVDGSDNAYVAGFTESTSGIATGGAHQTSFGGIFDNFIFKFNSSGTRLWSTYYGGSGQEENPNLALDASGNVYLGGLTFSTSAIATSGAHQTSLSGSHDAFLVKFNSSGARQWATYYGGTGDDYLYGLTTDNSGNILLGGHTTSSAGIATSGTHQTTNGGAADAYVAKFNTSGTRQWGTYFGGTGNEYAIDITADALDNVYITGQSFSSNGIATSGAYQSTLSGSNDAILVKLSSTGQRLWGTYYGGSGTDNANSVKLTNNGYVYIVGTTTSTSSIATTGSFQSSHGGAQDGFIAKFNINAPIVTTLSTSVANPGTSLTITGTNFNATPANNIVYFGGARATVTAASTTSLTVTTPNGATYAPVSVLNTATSLAGYSRYPFFPKYDNSLYYSGMINLDPSVDFATGTSPIAAGFGDLDGDGKTDAVVVNNMSSSAYISVFRNTSITGSISSSTFATRIDSTTANSPKAVALADLDLDGKLDVVVVGTSNKNVYIYRNTSTAGTISFANRLDITSGTGISNVNVACTDIDGDGKPEIIVLTSGTTRTVQVYRNLSSPGSLTTGSFAASIPFATGAPNSDGMVVTDINNDGKQDVAIVNGSTGAISIFENNSTSGTISFLTRVDFSGPGLSSSFLTAADIDGDGWLDLISSVSGGGNYISVYRNTATSGTISTASLASRVDFSTN